MPRETKLCPESAIQFEGQILERFGFVRENEQDGDAGESAGGRGATTARLFIAGKAPEEVHLELIQVASETAQR